ncbi:putative LacI-family transcriptional regulator [Actinoplanes missouriensis 431]|uniref:Putative LacI-family transcriptional regulator n=1 Tax=Actinoplanes missouriensis (strain ATCC 14538 / DSM 43046 / CBS 188.64 / JCM 3121 / NBRC 102363 / NCIMB 12654 / NRRL B-3342 / UNCC 431) TaxID=512565 RepID=I0HAR9_ACTM4|nr:LacI family DNA-binding transcriptional regulator [Actinoplanes missouriensis]BAL90106.1 putative LacI-family transcriptional regulator [Actinoplanes missouriensis 431]
MTAHPCLADVARRAGVSTATASRVLSGRGPSSAASRDAVRRAAADLGYVPHPVARRLAHRSGTRIVFAVRDARADILRDPFVTRAAAAISAATEPEGLGTALLRLPLSASAELDRLAADRSVAALVLAGHDRTLMAGLPAALRDRTAVIGAGGSDVDSAAGVGALLHHLYGSGRRRIALIAGPRWLAASRAPLTAYTRLIRATGLPERVVHGDFTTVRGRSAAREILRRWPDTDAIATVSDATALGVLQALAADGLRVPHDVAVTGFDDSPLAEAVHPGLSTATHPVELIAVSAVRAALGAPSPGRLFPSRPVLRTSCGGAP